MKHIKTFEKATESFKPKLEVGDYVVLNIDIHDENFNNFINSQVGLVTDIYVEISHTGVRIKYDNIPSNIRYMFLSNTDEVIFAINNIRFFSKNKKDLEYLIAEEKYNL